MVKMFAFAGLVAAGMGAFLLAERAHRELLIELGRVAAELAMERARAERLLVANKVLSGIINGVANTMWLLLISDVPKVKGNGP